MDGLFVTVDVAETSPSGPMMSLSLAGMNRYSSYGTPFSQTSSFISLMKMRDLLLKGGRSLCVVPCLYLKVAIT